MTTENNSIDTDEVSLKEMIFKMEQWVVYLKSRWKLIIIAGLIGSIIGISFSYLTKPTFKALLTFAMEDEKGSGVGGLSGALGLASSFGIDLGGAGGGGAFASSNITELMKSRLIVEKVLLNPITINGNKTTLAEYYITINELRKDWRNKNDLKSIQFLPDFDRNKYSRQQDSILYGIFKNVIDKNNLSIMLKDKKVSILSIEVISKNELFSKLFCENLAKETSRFYIETKSKKAKINVDVLQKQADSVRNELNSAINGVAIESDNVYNLNPAFVIRSAPSKKKQIDVQANTAILTNIVVQLELAKITLRKETPLIQLIDSPILPLEKKKIGKLISLILGGLLGVLLTVLFLIFREMLKRLLA